jgi:hypothetical protein
MPTFYATQVPPTYPLGDGYVVNANELAGTDNATDSGTFVTPWTKKMVLGKVFALAIAGATIKAASVMFQVEPDGTLSTVGAVTGSLTSYTFDAAGKLSLGFTTVEGVDYLTIRNRSTTVIAAGALRLTPVT